MYLWYSMYIICLWPNARVHSKCNACIYMGFTSAEGQMRSFSVNSNEFFLQLPFKYSEPIMLGHAWISFPLAKFVVKTLLLHEMLALFVLAIYIERPK